VSRPFLGAGDGLEIHRLDPTDAEALQAVIDRNRERLMRWMPWAEGSTVDTTRGFIAGNGDGLDPLGLIVEGALVGTIGARPDPMSGDAEIGYWLDETVEGRGVMTRASRVLISHLFDSVGVHRVTIRAAPDNARSRAIAERLGFTQEGVLREAGRSSPGYHDLVVYGLLDREWRS
jgi:RimJ/RimL family protein N-acetyltransferase